jgi:hypothetical protein
MRIDAMLLFASLVTLGAPALAQESGDKRHTAEIALSNDTLQLRYIGSGAMVGVDGAQISGTFFLSEQRDIVLNGGLAFGTNLELGPVSLLFGPRAYAALLEDENNDVMALSIGAEVRVDIIKKLGLAVTGEAYYAPDILTFGSADNLSDLNARVEIRVAPELRAFGGMRWFEFDLVEGEGQRELMKEAFVGFAYSF